MIMLMMVVLFLLLLLLLFQLYITKCNTAYELKSPVHTVNDHADDADFDVVTVAVVLMMMMYGIENY